MYKRILYLLLFACCGTSVARAQLSVDFVPSISGSTVDGLLNVRIINTGARQDVKLKVTVDELDEGRLLVVETGAFLVLPGVNTIPQNIIKTAKISISNNPRGKFLQQNGYFPDGIYNYEYVITKVGNNDILTEQSFSHHVEPSAPLNLMEPYDQDEICEERPLLSWQPNIPVVAGIQYQVHLVEVKAKQNITEALNYNMPVISQRGIMNNLLPYPAVTKSLEKGKTYAWQVTAYVNQIVVNRSEVWSFKVECPDSAKKGTNDANSYRDIEDLLKGNYYMAVGKLSFMLVNSYSEQSLQYSISCLTDPKLIVRKLPALTLKRGKNKIDIDLSKNKAFKSDYSYMLTVVLPNGEMKNLRFIYKE